MAAAGTQAGVGRATDSEGAGHPDRAEFLGETLDPTSRQREVLVHPDKGTGRDLFPVEQRVYHYKELPVVGPYGIYELVPTLGARLPVGAHGRATARVGVRVEPLGQHGLDSIGVGPVVHDEEVPDVVPRRRGDEARFARARAGGGIAL